MTQKTSSLRDDLSQKNDLSQNNEFVSQNNEFVSQNNEFVSQNNEKHSQNNEYFKIIIWYLSLYFIVTTNYLLIIRNSQNDLVLTSFLSEKT